MNEDTRAKMLKIEKEINKKYGKNTIYKASEQTEVQRVSSGSIVLDKALGGGIPRGRLTEIAGEESSGKTWTCMMVCKEAIERGIPVYWVDAEGTLDPTLLNEFHLTEGDLFNIVKCESGEDTLDACIRILRSGLNPLLVIDSMPALIPMKEVEEGFDKGNVGGNASMVTKALRIFTSILNKESRDNKTLKEEDPNFIDTGESIILVTNQLRDNIGGTLYSIPYKTPCGRGLKHSASIRVHLRRHEWVPKISTNGEAKIGQVIAAKVVKNKTFPPNREAIYTIKFPPECSLVDKDLEVISMAIEYGLISRAGSWFSFEGKNVAQGQEKTIEALKKDPKAILTLSKQLLSMFPYLKWGLLSAEELAKAGE